MAIISTIVVSIAIAVALIALVGFWWAVGVWLMTTMTIAMLWVCAAQDQRTSERRVSYPSFKRVFRRPGFGSFEGSRYDN